MNQHNLKSLAPGDIKADNIIQKISAAADEANKPAEQKKVHECDQSPRTILATYHGEGGWMRRAVHG